MHTITKKHEFIQCLQMIIVGSSLALTGCVTPMVKEPVTKETTLNCPFDKVWGSAVTAVAEGGNEINVAEKSSGVIAFKRKLNKGDVAKYSSDKPNQPPWPIGVMGAHYANGELIGNLRVKATADTNITVSCTIRMSALLCDIMGQPVFAFGGPTPKAISSNGTFEEEVFTAIKPMQQ
jgi:hypothetical protein